MEKLPYPYPAATPLFSREEASAFSEPIAPIKYLLSIGWPRLAALGSLW